jgi:zinc transporter, ZIP family
LELIPRLVGDVSKLEVGLGFFLGVIRMLALKVFTHGLDDEEHEEEAKGVSKGMVLGIILDLLIDGILIGLAFLAGMEMGILIATALAIETFSLGLALSVSFKKSRSAVWKSFFFIFAIALAAPCGAAFSLFVLDALPHSFDIIMLAFGTAALLYLVTEELLLKAHETPDTPWVTASFFLGFVTILLLN